MSFLALHDQRPGVTRSQVDQASERWAGQCCQSSLADINTYG